MGVLVSISQIQLYLCWQCMHSHQGNIFSGSEIRRAWKVLLQCRGWLSQNVLQETFWQACDHTRTSNRWVLWSSISQGTGWVWCTRRSGPKYYAVNLVLRFFLYHFLHTMSSWCHDSIHNNTNNQQTPPPWWWSRLPLQRRGLDESTPPKRWAALRINFPRLLLKGFIRINKLQ